MRIANRAERSLTVAALMWCRSRDRKGAIALCAALVAAGCFAQTTAHSTAHSTAQSTNQPQTRDITLLEGRGELLTFPRDVTKVAISEPKIADAVVISPREVMINAKGPGRATLVIWETGADPRKDRYPPAATAPARRTAPDHAAGEVRRHRPRGAHPDRLQPVQHQRYNDRHHQHGAASR